MNHIEYLNLRLETSGKSRAEVAREIGMNTSSVCRMMLGKQDLSIETIIKLSESLDFPAKQLLMLTFEHKQRAMRIEQAMKGITQ